MAVIRDEEETINAAPFVMRFDWLNVALTPARKKSGGKRCGFGPGSPSRAQKPGAPFSSCPCLCWCICVCLCLKSKRKSDGAATPTTLPLKGKSGIGLGDAVPIKKRLGVSLGGVPLSRSCPIFKCFPLAVSWNLPRKRTISHEIYEISFCSILHDAFSKNFCHKNPYIYSSHTPALNIATFTNQPTPRLGCHLSSAVYVIIHQNCVAARKDGNALLAAVPVLALSHTSLAWSRSCYHFTTTCTIKTHTHILVQILIIVSSSR